MEKKKDNSSEFLDKHKMVIGNTRQEYYFDKYSKMNIYQLEKSLEMLRRQCEEYKKQRNIFSASLCLPEIVYLQDMIQVRTNRKNLNDKTESISDAKPGALHFFCNFLISCPCGRERLIKLHVLKIKYIELSKIV